MEQVLRTHRDQAYKLLEQNEAQSREGIELLVKGRIGAIAVAAGADPANLTTEQMEQLYNQLLDLSHVMFSLGYTLARTLKK